MVYIWATSSLSKSVPTEGTRVEVCCVDHVFVIAVCDYAVLSAVLALFVDKPSENLMRFLRNVALVLFQLTLERRRVNAHAVFVRQKCVALEGK